jgi:hypothetical protein
MPRSHEARFEAELIEGHKGVHVVIVPFDPEDVFARKPVRLHGRRHGWPVTGTVNKIRFDGYVGDRWGNFFVIIDEELRKKAKLSAGDTLSIVIEPTATARALAHAMEQSKQTTQPKKARTDVIDP